MSFQQRCTVTEAGHARLLSLPLPLQERYGLFQRQIVKIKDGHLKETHWHRAEREKEREGRGRVGLGKVGVWGDTVLFRSRASRHFKMDCDLLVSVFPPLATVTCNHLSVMIGSFDCLHLFMLVELVHMTTD